MNVSLIDQTYFQGDLTIAGLDRPSVIERLNLFIEKYEDQFLRDLFGYSMYKALLDGLSEPSVDQRWLDILQGTEYEYSGRTRQWRGLVMLAPAQSLTVLPASDQTLIVGRGQLYDPVAGQMTMTLPPDFVGVYFRIERRGTGRLSSDEYSVVGNLLTLIGMPTWNTNETIFLEKNASLSLGDAGAAPLSPIANYVYWYYQKDITTQTVGLGQVQSKGENSVVVSPVAKMVRAWNEMFEWLTELRRFLDQNYSTYPEWDSSQSNWWKFKTQNVFGI